MRNNYHKISYIYKQKYPYLQINFIRAIFPKLKGREIYKEDDLLTYEIAVNICRDYLGVEPCFKNEDFIIPNDEQLQEPKKHR